MHKNLAFYTLAGAPKSPRELVSEIKVAEELGIGSVFISERFNIKEAAVLCGAIGAVSDKIHIITGATNHNTRHPIVTASIATTMHFLTEGRFTLGIGRGIPQLQDAYGMGRISTRQMEDFAILMKRLWGGEAVSGYKSSIGSYPYLSLDPSFKENIPLGLVAFGPNSLALGGREFNDVILHTFFTDETTANAVSIVKESAIKSGRKPSEVKVWSCLATIGDHIPYPLKVRKTVGRMATYLRAYGELLVKTNNWDMKVLKRFKESEIVKSFTQPIDSPNVPTERLEQVGQLIPEEWLKDAAYGTPQQCCDAIQNQLNLGCDGVILHGATPSELAPIIKQWDS